MSSRFVWLTHPNLTPAHDQKVLAETVGQWSASGWQVREDQREPWEIPDVAPFQQDPPPDVDVDVTDSGEQSPPNPETPAEDVAPVAKPARKRS